MKKFLISITAILLLLTNCTTPNDQLTPTPTIASTVTIAADTPIATPEYRYLALGDSYTIGEGVAISQRYPILLTQSLRKEGLRIADPVIIARTGWTTDELSAGIDAANPSGTFELVTLLIGVNDQFRGRSIEEYRVQFIAVLNKAIVLTGEKPNRVIVISIPDWSVTPAASGQNEQRIASEIDALNKINREESQKLGARYVNVTELSRLAIEDKSLITRDGLHFTGEMYSMWLPPLLSEALEILGQ